MELMNASEVVGEIRKMARVFEALKEAEKIVNIVASQERYLAELTATIQEVEGLEGQLNERLAKLDKTLEDRVAAIRAAEKDFDEVIATKEAEGIAIIQAAEIKAKEVIADADAQIRSTLNAAVEAQTRKDELDSQVSAALARKHEIEEQLQAAKDRVFSLLG